ncbi:B2 protein-like [Athalia rosae]|uniref:B2 protein-like n=1 Tax=Athalia rosae TaxID=37344 RepID=UPI002033F839|nr:B2 protein-like [Athalia rosae]
MMQGMKISAFLFVVFLLIIQGREANGNVRKECRKESGVSWAALEKLKDGDLEYKDPKLKCYLKCFLVKNGIMSEANEIEIEKSLRHLPRKLQEGSRKILERCKNKRGSDSCDTAFQIAKCYFQEHPEVLQRVNLV